MYGLIRQHRRRPNITVSPAIPLPKMKIGIQTLNPLLTVAIVGLLLLSGCGEQGKGAPEPRSITSRGLYPTFDPHRSRYVSRCGREAEPIEITTPHRVKVSVDSGPSMSGAVTIHTATRPGSDFSITISSQGRSRTYRVRCLPADFPTWRYEALRPT